MIYLTDQNFEEEIKHSEKPILVDFFAIWCPPCQILSPILEELEEEFEGKIIFAKLNTDLSPLTSRKYGIESIPTLILFKNGKPLSGFIGLKPKEEIKKWLENYGGEND